MVNMFNHLKIYLLFSVLVCLLSCNHASTYLNESKFEKMRSKCLTAIPDSYSFRFNPPESFYLLVNVNNEESTVEYYLYFENTPVSRDDISDWISKEGSPRRIKSNPILLDIKSIDDVFSYTKALYEDQLNDYKSSPNGRYLSTWIKYDDNYFFPKSFHCDIRKPSYGINVPPSAIEPVSVTIENFSVDD